MSIQKEELLTLANELCTSGAEPHWRSAISRAYYAAFHGCNAWHKALPMPGANAGKDGGIHQQLINRLRNPDSATPEDKRKRSKILAAQLEVLRGQRHVADYDLCRDIDQVVADNACLQARTILEKL